MNKISLLQYLKKEVLTDEDIADALRYELDKHVYYYGNQFVSPLENNSVQNIQGKAKNLIKQLFFHFKYLTQAKTASGLNVASNAYFNFNDELQKLGMNVISPTWAIRVTGSQILGNKELYRNTEKIREHLRESDFTYLISETFLQEVRLYREKLYDAYLHENIRALFVPNDVSFFENLSIQIFRELKRPSFIFLHGLPARYNIIDDNRTDYLVVWGPRIRQHYIDAGFSPEKILVAGHPSYSGSPVPQLRTSRDNILVLAKIAVGSHHSDEVKLYDRGNIIVYLLMIQKVLRKLGVNKVRLRLHPSANSEWHYQFIDRNFFELDTLPLSTSLSKSSLVIGPTSTVFLEALHAGINYLVFEPTENGSSLLNERPVPPFDSSEEKIPIAGNEDELEAALRDRKMVDPSILDEYIKAPFDIQFLKDLI